MWYPTQKKSDLKKCYSIGGVYLAVVNSRSYNPLDNITHMVVMDREWKVMHDPSPKGDWQDENLFNNNDLKHIYKFRRMNKTDMNYWHYV